MDVFVTDAHMAIVKFIFILLASTSLALAADSADITAAFKRKDWKTISEIFRDAPNNFYSRQDLIYISYSLRQMEFYRQDIKLNVRLINQKYKAKHTQILQKIRKGESLDSDEYPEAMKVLYWNLMMDFSHIIMGYDNKSTKLDKDRAYFNTFSKILSELEFRESKVDKLNDQVVAHLHWLDNKIYKFVSGFAFTYLSWQSQAKLHGPNRDVGLIVTNKGFCAGGEVGYENYMWHFYVDGCLMMGSGGIQAQKNTDNVTYQQSNVPAYGVKISPGVSMMVSSSKSRIGLRVPIIYSVQNLSDPDPTTGYQALNEAPINVVTALYSRWQFNRWYFDTEFGKYLAKEQTMWSLGVGYNF